MTAKLRQTARKAVLDLLGLVSRPQPGVHILNGHTISRNADNCLTAADADRFRRQLKALQKAGVRFVRFEDAVSRIAAGDRPDAPLVAFSFDDGFMEHYTHIAPVLEEFGVNGAFFINPHFAEGDDAYIEDFTDHTVLTPGKHPMRWEQIADLHRRGHVIGAHTLDHYMINDDNIAELRHQIVDCRRHIEERLGAPCPCFAFPYGRLEHANPQSIDIACEAYDYVFSQSDHRHYFSYGGKVINRRHFEPFWPVRHLYYFLCRKS